MMWGVGLDFSTRKWWAGNSQGFEQHERDQRWGCLIGESLAGRRISPNVGAEGAEHGLRRGTSGVSRL